MGLPGYPFNDVGLPVSSLKANWPDSGGVPVIFPLAVTVQPGVSVTRQFVSTAPEPVTSNTDWPAAGRGTAQSIPRSI